MPDNIKTIKKVKWYQITTALNAMHDYMREHYFIPAGIVAVARGGLVPATVLAHMAGVRKVVSIQLESYADGEMQGGELTTYGNLPEDLLEAKGKGWLVFDDIVDSGNSMAYMKRLLPLAKTACIFLNDQAPRVDYWWNRYKRDIWIKFPWEQTL